MKAVNKVTGTKVTADESVLARLGPEWEAEKAPAKKAAPKAPAKK